MQRILRTGCNVLIAFKSCTTYIVGIVAVSETMLKTDEVPSEVDWLYENEGGFIDRLDYEASKKKFYGLSIDEAKRIIIQDPLCVYSDFRFMPYKPFLYYIQSYFFAILERRVNLYEEVLCIKMLADLILHRIGDGFDVINDLGGSRSVFESLIEILDLYHKSDEEYRSLRRKILEILGMA